MSVRVYKVGGPALEDPGLIGPLAEEVRRGEGPAVLVHGGGRAVDRLLKALHIESRFIEGRRIWEGGLKRFPESTGLQERMGLTSLMVDDYVARERSWIAGPDTDSIRAALSDLPDLPELPEGGTGERGSRP